VNEYCEGAAEYLAHAYDAERALFSYSTVLGPDGAIVNDFDHPQTHRYTINTYLGLKEAERHGGPIPWLGDVDGRVLDFVSQHFDGLDSHADLGLLLVLLADVAPTHEAVGASIAQIAEAIERGDAVRRFDMQDLAWMLWGLVATEGDERAAALAHRIFSLIRTHFVHPVSRLPRHRVARYRANIVSFGSLVYFLRAMWEYGERYGDPEARALFADGVRSALALQGPAGEWPWMIDVRTGMPFDLYPVFTVHQDSMAMLFLFPAAEQGMPGVEEAIERSFRWNFGQNERGVSLVLEEPCFWVHRAIERDERHPRLRRYLRGLGRPASASPPRSTRVRVNRECRSYHLGWVLYTWSSRAAVPGLAVTPVG
jgi:hypothetical protein